MELFHENIHITEKLPADVIRHAGTSAPVPRHWHRGVEFIYTISASLIVWINGEEKKVPLNELVVINSSDVHSVGPDPEGERKDDGRCISMAVSYDYIKGLCPEIDDIYFQLDGNEEHQKELKTIFLELDTIYARLETQEEKSYDFLLTNSLILQCFYLLLTYFSFRNDKSTTVKTQKYMDRLKGIMQDIRDHSRETLTLEEVACQNGLSREHLSRIFKKYTGSTFKEYLDSIRLEQAFQELMSTDYTMLRIAEDCGFADVRNFIQTFKRFYGVTPYHYKKKISQKANPHVDQSWIDRIKK